MNNRFLEANPGDRAKTDWAQKLYGVIVFVYGVALVAQFLSALMMSIGDAVPTDAVRGVLEHTTPLFYIPALILFFCKCREFSIFLTLAYAYDMGIHTAYVNGYSLSGFFSAYPLFTVTLAALLITGFFYRGFWVRYRWIYRIIRDKRHKNEEANSFLESPEGGEPNEK